VNVHGECYAHVDSQPTMDGMGAEVDGEFSLLGLAEAAIAALPQEDDRELTLGVGDGSGNLFVYGSYDAIKRTQQIIFEREQLSRDVDLLREALTDIANRNTALEDGSDYARGWNAARYRMRQIVEAALGGSDGLATD
jgi:hypothetical protein